MEEIKDLVAQALEKKRILSKLKVPCAPSGGLGMLQKLHSTACCMLTLQIKQGCHHAVNTSIPMCLLVPQSFHSMTLLLITCDHFWRTCTNCQHKITHPIHHPISFICFLVWWQHGLEEA